MKTIYIALIVVLLISPVMAGLCIHPDSGMAYWYYDMDLLENGTQIQIVDASLREFYDAPPAKVIWIDVETVPISEREWL